MGSGCADRCLLGEMNTITNQTFERVLWCQLSDEPYLL